jgi:hypothetical protein
MPVATDIGKCNLLWILGQYLCTILKDLGGGLGQGSTLVEAMAIGPRVASPDVRLCPVHCLFYIRDKNVDVFVNRRREVNNELSPRGTIGQVAHTCWRGGEVHELRF